MSVLCRIRELGPAMLGLVLTIEVPEDLELVLQVLGKLLAVLSIMVGQVGDIAAMVESAAADLIPGRQLLRDTG